MSERALPGTVDPLSVLEHIEQAERGLCVLADFGPYLAPFGQPEPLLVRRLRARAWAIKARPVTVLFVGLIFHELAELEKEIKVVDLPLPDESEVAGILDLQLARLADHPDVQLAIYARTREQLVQALLGLTEAEIENALEGGDHAPGNWCGGGAPHLRREAVGHSPERRTHLQPP